MTNVCDFSWIWWANPGWRWIWEAVCGYGGTILKVTIIMIAVILILKKIFW